MILRLAVIKTAHGTPQSTTSIGFTVGRAVARQCRCYGSATEYSHGNAITVCTSCLHGNRCHDDLRQWAGNVKMAADGVAMNVHCILSKPTNDSRATTMGGDGSAIAMGRRPITLP